MNVFAGLDRIFVGVFGDEAMYTPTAGTPRALKVIFEEAGETLVSDGEVEVISRIPYADFSQADVERAVEGDRLTVRGKTYTFVGDAIPDGRGMVRWMLERV